MAQPCRECGALIPPDETNCPECGALVRPVSPRTAIVVALAIVAFFLLLIYGGLSPRH